MYKILDIVTFKTDTNMTRNVTWKKLNGADYIDQVIKYISKHQVPFTIFAFQIENKARQNWWLYFLHILSRNNA